MKPVIGGLLIGVVATVVGACGVGVNLFVGRPIETRFAFTNFSREFYAALRLRSHVDDGDALAFTALPLLAPGATHRGDFLDLSGGCPESLDFELLLYRRVNADLPIGLDDSESVDPDPIVAGTISDIPACEVGAVETYTILNWEAEEGTARVKFAQFTSVDDEIRRRQLFTEPDAAWEIQGVDPTLADTAPPELPAPVALAGRVTLADGTGVELIGVLVRTRFRVRLDDADPSNDPDAGFGDPIAVTETDADGLFRFDRPSGAYQVEFFSDDFEFRPDVILVESPIENIVTLAEPR